MANVYLLLGLDCDRPRGKYIMTPEGARMAEEKYLSLKYISEKLDTLRIPRTYFICGQFLESMISKFGPDKMRKLFEGKTNLVEISDHTYSHNIFKKIGARPDKTPLSIDKIIEEYKYNTALFSNFFNKDLTKRGMRTPLGHYQGLLGEDELIANLKGEGVLYVSSDLRQEDDSICPSLQSVDGILRQPYFYSAGLLEIPSHGWHDTAFGGLTKTPLMIQPPSTYHEIIQCYYLLLQEAVHLAQTRTINIYIGLVLHPYNIWQYDKPKTLFDDLHKISNDLGIELARYEDAYYNVLEGQ